MCGISSLLHRFWLPCQRLLSKGPGQYRRDHFSTQPEALCNLSTAFKMIIDAKKREKRLIFCILQT